MLGSQSRELSEPNYAVRKLAITGHSSRSLSTLEGKEKRERERGGQREGAQHDGMRGSEEEGVRWYKGGLTVLSQFWPGNELIAMYFHTFPHHSPSQPVSQPATVAAAATSACLCSKCEGGRIPTSQEHDSMPPIAVILPLLLIESGVVCGVVSSPSPVAAPRPLRLWGCHVACFTFP